MFYQLNYSSWYGHLEEASRVWLRRFSPTEYQAPPCGSPDPRYDRTTTRYQALILNTGCSYMKGDNSHATHSLQLSLLMSPSQYRYPSQYMLFPPPQRSPLVAWIQHVRCLLTQTLPIESLHYCYFNKQIYPRYQVYLTTVSCR